MRTINSVWLNVSKITRAIEFYERMLDMRVRAQQDGMALLKVGGGPQFVALVTGNGAKPGINHFCLGVEHFDAKRITKTLADNDLKGQLTMRGKTPEVTLSDPDGIPIQLQDVSYCGGSGDLGNVCDSRVQ